jgi:hypothetical protein
MIQLQIADCRLPIEVATADWGVGIGLPIAD